MPIETRILNPFSPIRSTSASVAPTNETASSEALSSNPSGLVKRACASRQSYIGWDPEPDTTGETRRKRRRSTFGHRDYDPDYRAPCAPQAPAAAQPSDAPTTRAQAAVGAARPVADAAIEAGSDDDIRTSRRRARPFSSSDHTNSLFLPDFSDTDSDSDSDSDLPLLRRASPAPASAAASDSPSVDSARSTSVLSAQAARLTTLMQALAFSDAQKQVMVESIEDELAKPLAVMIDLNPTMFVQEGAPKASYSSTLLARYYKKHVLPTPQGFEALANLFRFFCTPEARVTSAGIPGRSACLEPKALKYVMGKLNLDERQKRLFQDYENAPKGQEMTLRFRGEALKRFGDLANSNPSLHALIEAHAPLGARIQASSTLLHAVLAKQPRLAAILSDTSLSQQVTADHLSLHALLHAAALPQQDPLALAADTTDVDAVTQAGLEKADARLEDDSPASLHAAAATEPALVVSSPALQPAPMVSIPVAHPALVQPPTSSSLLQSTRTIGPDKSVAACLAHVNAASFPLLSNPTLLGDILARKATLASLDLAKVTKLLSQELQTYGGLIEGMRTEITTLQQQQRERGAAARDRKMQAARDEQEARAQEQRILAQQQARAAQAHALQAEADREEQEARRVELELEAMANER